MAKPFSVDLRERVYDAVWESLSRHQAAARFKVSASSAKKTVHTAEQPRSDERRPTKIASRCSLNCIRRNLFSSARRAPRQRWLGCAAEHPKANAALLRSPTAIG